MEGDVPIDHYPGHLNDGPETARNDERLAEIACLERTPRR
ncbi:hypothetical protein STVIR_4900 [Streptomyces viridochromogenes Tue57]|uniref:Uncharacterized protein n=1 Tax=Streptomyces viridochromogenes Tue57 TaxID=1160705 RepID=L8PCG9_STRVR|nr:hypothetical protein STVIR_4900 [Streptomyces viridochromogenes Tue57]